MDVVSSAFLVKGRKDITVYSRRREECVCLVFLVGRS